MKVHEWNKEKNEWLKKMRKISFENVIEAIENDCLLTQDDHPNKGKYAHQKIYIVEINKYAYIVPYVEEEQKIFMKTIIPSRKATKKYL